MTEAPREPKDERKNHTAKVIRDWLASKGIKRLRGDRRVGLPEKKILAEWAGIVLEQGIEGANNAEALVDRALAAANWAGQWSSWNLLALQIQIAAEQLRRPITADAPTADQPSAIERDDAPADWKTIKSRIRERIPEIAFQNWFDETRQVERRGLELVVAVPDETTAAYIRTEYEHIVHAAAAAKGLSKFICCRTGRLRRR